MAKYSLQFHGTEITNTDDTSLECFLNTKGEITISIKEKQEAYPIIISLDISTAIKFAKTVRTEINKAKEVQND